MRRRILLMLSTIIFLVPACQGVTPRTETMPVKPVRPRIEAVKRADDGGVCFSAEDAYLLFLYIQQLERGYCE